MSSENAALPQDRKLGDEWGDWDGSAQADSTRASAWLFLALAGAAGLGMACLAAGIAWLIYPRMLSLGLGRLEWILLAGVGAYLVLWYASILLAAGGLVLFKKPARVLGGIRWIAAPAMMLGKLLGSRDRVAHSFLLSHNRIEILPDCIPAAERLLVLAPRCLSRPVMDGLRNLRERYHFSLVVATGGTEARRAIEEKKPRGIIAVACERDLLSGVKDLNGKVPLWTMANDRPEGPCKNTVISLEAMEKMVIRFLGKQIDA